MRKYFEGPINPRTGERIYAGRMRGSESENVQTFPVGRSASTGSSMYWAFGNDFDWLTFDFDRDMNVLEDAMAARLKST